MAMHVASTSEIMDGNDDHQKIRAGGEEEAPAEGHERDDGSTPHRMFRGAEGAADPEGGTGRRDDIDGSEAEEEDASSDDDDDEDDGDECENLLPTDAAAAASSAHGLLSPNSIEIRENARRILLRQPGNHRGKKNRRRRSSLQPLSLASFMNSGGGVSPRSDPDAGVPEKPRAAAPAKDLNLKAATEKIEREIEANVAEVREAARAVATRAVEAGGECIEAFELGLGALSTGVATKARRARRSLSVFGQGLVWD